MNSQRDKSLFHSSLRSGSQIAIRLFSTLRCRSGNRDILRNFFKKNSKTELPQEVKVKKRTKFSLPKGFTLIELLAVTAIITILTAAILVNYRNSEQQFALQRSTHKLAQDIRRAGEMAMSAKECCGGIVPQGYGIWLEQGSSNYILYADTQPFSGDEFYTSFSEKIETIELEKGVVIQGINTANGKVGINFKPPTPTIKIKYQISNEINEVVITLASSGNVKTVKINAVGLVEVEYPH